MNCIKKTLSNGLRIIAVPISSSESATVTVWVRTGSRFEDAETNGLSHFLEHMVFKGTKKRPSAKIISEEVDALGAEFNAGTSKEWTNFYIKARSKVIPQAFDILSDMVLAPLLKSEEIEREKGVIIQEINLYEDNPVMKIGDVFENVVFRGSKLSWDIAGSPQTVKCIERQDFIDYRKQHYFPENMLICVSGNVTEKEVEKLSDRYFSSLKKTNKALGKPEDKLKQRGPEVLVSTKKTDQTHIMLGFKSKPMGDASRYIEGVLGTILGGGMSSRLFIEVRERRGLAYSVRTVGDHVLDNGYFATYSGVRTAKASEAITIILDQYYKLASGKIKITSKELAKAKEFMKGHIALSLEDSKSIGDFFAYDELMLAKTRTPGEVYKNIDSVTAGDVVSFAKEIFVSEGLNLAVIGPFESKERFQKLLY